MTYTTFVSAFSWQAHKRAEEREKTQEVFFHEPAVGKNTGIERGLDKGAGLWFDKRG